MRYYCDSFNVLFGLNVPETLFAAIPAVTVACVANASIRSELATRRTPSDLHDAFGNQLDLEPFRIAREKLASFRGYVTITSYIHLPR